MHVVHAYKFDRQPVCSTSKVIDFFGCAFFSESRAKSCIIKSKYLQKRLALWAFFCGWEGIKGGLSLRLQGSTLCMLTRNRNDKFAPWDNEAETLIESKSGLRSALGHAEVREKKVSIVQCLTYIVHMYGTFWSLCRFGWQKSYNLYMEWTWKRRKNFTSLNVTPCSPDAQAWEVLERNHMRICVKGQNAQVLTEHRLASTSLSVSGSLVEVAELPFQGNRSRREKKQ